MRKILTFALVLGMAVLISASASAGNGKLLKNGHVFGWAGTVVGIGHMNTFMIFNQYSWNRDADGDGIPNGIDDDYVKPEDGTGFGATKPKSSFGYGPEYQKSSDNGKGDLIRLRDRDKTKLKDGSCTR